MNRWIRCGSRVACNLLVSMSLCLPGPEPVSAAPSNPTVTAGQVAISGLGTKEVIVRQTSPQAIINWRQFNLAHDEVAVFQQRLTTAPGQAAQFGIALNRIADIAPSQILGQIRADGSVILLNPNGIFFGPQSQVHAGGFLASSLNLSDRDFLRGRYLFEGTAANGIVQNEGQISRLTEGNGGGLGGIYLLAPTVENNGVITSPDGQIALAGGTSVFLSSRPDGRGLFVEVRAPEGAATNLKDLIAEGGDVSLSAKVVNQQGLVKANSVRERNGRIELFASEHVTVKAGSRMEAKGGTEGGSDAGRILVEANKLAGKVTIENGAVLDVSGGSLGGHGGIVEVVGKTVALGGQVIGTVSNTALYRPGKLVAQADKVTDLSSLFLGDAEVQISSDHNLEIAAGSFDFIENGWALAEGQIGTLRLTAGHNLLIKQTFLTNGANEGDLGTRWDLKATAGNDLILSGSKIDLNFGATVDLRAGRDLRLEINSRIANPGGGEIRLQAGRDLYASSSLSGGNLISNTAGVRMDGTGTINLIAGRHVLGGDRSGNGFIGPGFVLSSGQGSVIAGGDIGREGSYANFIVGGGLRKSGEIVERIADPASLSLDAGGPVRLGLVSDLGLWARSGAEALTLDSSNRVSVVSRTGEIFLNPDTTFTSSIGALKINYPGDFLADARRGSVVVERAATFWPSLTAGLTLLARDNIEGVRPLVPGTRGLNAEELNELRIGGLLPSQIGLKGLIERGFSELEADRLLTAESTPVPTLIPGAPPKLSVVSADPRQLLGFKGEKFNEVSRTFPKYKTTDVILDTDPSTGLSRPFHLLEEATRPDRIQIKTELGDIRALVMDFTSPTILKQVNVDSGRDIAEFYVNFSLPNLGKDAVGREIPSVTISAKRDINLAKTTSQAGPSGIYLTGPGTASMQVGRNFDLADSDGITVIGGSSTGVLDIQVGGNLDMTTSRILTEDRTHISIHGFGADSFVTNEGALALDTIQVDASNVPLNDQAPVLPTILKEFRGQLVLYGLQRNREGKKDTQDRLIYELLPVRFRSEPVALTGHEQVVTPNQTTGGVVNVLAGAGIGDSKIVIGERPAQFEGQALLPLLVEGRFVLFNDHVVMMAGTKFVLVAPKDLAAARPVGGIVNVGSNVKPTTQAGSSQALGIIAVNGGDIDVSAKGNIEVNTSRLATIGVKPGIRGGNIRLTSTEGSINAGSGGKTEQAPLSLELTKLDADGNPILDDKGNPVKEKFFLLVPGSGIFTFHAEDPPLLSLNFPEFDTPEITALKAEIVKQRFFGRNTSSMEAQVSSLVEERIPIFNQVFDEFVKPLLLGDITLNTAPRGLDLVVPPAGIRGRKISVATGRDLVGQGGAIEGQIDLDVKGEQKGNFTFVGTQSGSVGGSSVSAANSGSGGSIGGGLSGVTSGVSASSSSTASTASTTSTTVSQAADSVGGSTAPGQAAARAMATKAAKESGDKRKKSVRLKSGVTITVEAKAKTGT